MKKQLFAAAVAACLMGAAQAATVSWNAIGGGSSAGALDLSGTSHTCAVGETKTYALIVSGVSNLSTDSAKTLFAISSGKGNNHNEDPKVFIKQQGDGDGTSTFKYQVNGGDITDFADLTEGGKPGMTNSGSAALALTIARGADGAATITFYLDGTQIGTASFGADTDPLTYIVYGENFDGGSAYNGTWELYETDDAVLAADITVDGIRANVIPEPTALALLALGVAGMALRRRVA